MLWFCPDQRGIIDFADVKINRSLKKFLAKTNFTVTFNQAFEEVILECSRVPRPGQAGTWITPPIIKAYQQFHQAGYAHSVEVWQGANLVGGLYGVSVGALFAGESMFFKKSNASKVALLGLMQELKRLGHTWLDIQMLTPVTESLGGKYITKKEFFERLK